MPGRDYNRAYAAFEQSLGGTTYPTASVGSFEWSRHNSQKRAAPVSQSVRIARNEPQPASHRWRKDDSRQTRRHSAGVSPFPPTPPPNVALDEALANPSRGELYSQPPYRPRLSTPITALSTPTPDTTPPSLVHHLTPDLPDAAQSSSSAQTSSFATAKEAQASRSDVGSPVDLPLQGARAPQRPGNGGLRNLGWGIESLDVDDEPIGHGKVKEGSRGGGATGLGSIAPWASLPLTRFAMQERDSERRGPSGITFFEDDILPSNESPDKESTESSWLESSSVEHLGLTDSKTETRLSPSDSQSKRFSQTSRHSTVVGAAVYDSPPQRARTLRHVSKKKVLRDEASSSPESARPSAANRESPAHRLSHKKGQLLDRQSDICNGSPGLETSLQEPFTEPTSFLAMDSTNKSPTMSASDAHRRTSSWTKSRPISEPLVWDQLAKADAVKGSESATVAMRSMGAEPVSYPKSPFHHLENIDEQVDLGSSPGSRVSDTRFSPQPNELASHSRSKSTSLKRRGRVFPRELQHLSNGANSEPSAGTPAATLSAQRTPQLTSPLSSQCETPEALFVSEATAVSIHPHKNNSVHSVLVIQHPSPTDSDPSMGNDVPSTVAEESANSEFRINEASSTPPATPPIYEPAIESVNSPLQHPRSPPLPPTVSIIPPTPSKNGELIEANAGGTTHSATRPSRRGSLAKRARRYSDSLGSPFLSFADEKFSRPRRLGSRRRQEFINEDDDRDKATLEANDPPHHLHPSWQPRLLQQSTSLDSNQLINQSVNHPVNASNTAHKVDQGSTPPPIGGTSTMPAPPSGSLRRLLKRSSTSATSAPTSLRSSSRKAGMAYNHSTKGSTTDNAHPNRNSLASLFDFGRTNSIASRRRSRPATWFLDSETDRLPEDTSPYSNANARDRPDQANVTAPLPSEAPPSAASNPAKGGSLLRGLSKKLQERSKRREEQQQQEKRDKLRNSIGPRIYVEPGDVSGPVSHV